MRTRVGYAGGSTMSPTYRRIGDHAEAVQFDYDPTRVTYEDLLELFWAEHDPRYPPYSRQYMSAVFCATDEERTIALRSMNRGAERTGHTLHTEITVGARFYRAEDYHQKYYLRARRELLRELAGYDERAFVDSTVAARLNGYAGGEGTSRLLAAELDSMGLSAAGQSVLREMVGLRSG